LGRLTASFFARSALDVAPALLGCVLVHDGPQGRRAGRIVEVEAYLGDGSDPASHSHNGPTPRSRVMFGPPARFYVYRSMGLHVCANVVCEPTGTAAAVLLRAIEPLEGVELMRRARRGQADRDLTNGPGKLSQAMGIELAHNRAPALRKPLRLTGARDSAAGPILAGPRIGISRATEHPYRFFCESSPWVTRSPLNRAARPLVDILPAMLRAAQS